jgi:hypothetical protein
MVTAIFSNLPMSFRSFWRGSQYRIVYRGPRNTLLDRGRSPISRQSTCLKANAVTFSVYRRTGFLNGIKSLRGA